MNRRTLLKTGSLALAGFGVGVHEPIDGSHRAAARRRAAACGQPRAGQGRPGSGHSDHGRPPSASRFRLRSESRKVRREDGHSQLRPWRRRHVARLGHRRDGRDLALADGQRRAAVLGCGSPGLTAARQLQRRGFDVTIYAMAVPPDTTSNMSTAGFTPTSGLVSAERRTPAMGRAIPPGRRNLVPAAPAPCRIRLRCVLDGQLQRHRRSHAPQAAGQ